MTLALVSTETGIIPTQQQVTQSHAQHLTHLATHIICVQQQMQQQHKMTVMWDPEGYPGLRHPTLMPRPTAKRCMPTSGTPLHITAMGIPAERCRAHNIRLMGRAGLCQPQLQQGRDIFSKAGQQVRQQLPQHILQAAHIQEIQALHCMLFGSLSHTQWYTTEMKVLTATDQQHMTQLVDQQQVRHIHMTLQKT